MRIIRSNPVLAVHDLEVSGHVVLAMFLAVYSMTSNPGIGGSAGPATSPSCSGHCPNVLAASEIGDHSYVAYLHVDDVDAFHPPATAAGADVMHGPRDEPWGMRELALRSPDGHHFTLGEAIEQA